MKDFLFLIMTEGKSDKVKAKNHTKRKGDIGTIVHCYKDNKALEVEFITADGRTVALLTLEPKEIRPLKNREVLHVRELTELVV